MRCHPERVLVRFRTKTSRKPALSEDRPPRRMIGVERGPAFGAPISAATLRFTTLVRSRLPIRRAGRITSLFASRVLFNLRRIIPDHRVACFQIVCRPRGQTGMIGISGSRVVNQHSRHGIGQRLRCGQFFRCRPDLPRRCGKIVKHERNVDGVHRACAWHVRCQFI